MSDFFQNGQIVTLHDLAGRPTGEFEAELIEFSRSRPLGLVLPSLYSELEGPALDRIVEELAQVEYLNEIVIGLDAADAEQFKRAKDFFSRLPQPHHVLWNDGPRLRALADELETRGLAPTQQGKGRNVWFCFGYVLACARAEALALHDCDITTYDRRLLARLIYPVANPSFSFAFCKGYYSRISGRELKGRVARLLVAPLLRALRKVFGPHDFVEYLDSFRYPLAGECSLRTYVLKDLYLPDDWGLEIGLLAEIRRMQSSRRICQIDIADLYDHKHQQMGTADARAGLSKMSADICKAVFRKMAIEGEVFSEGVFRSLKAAYLREALDLVERYQSDAVTNGLNLDRDAEEQAAELFASNLLSAGQDFLAHPMESSYVPSWRRVRSAIPDFLQRLELAVEEDNQE